MNINISNLLLDFNKIYSHFKKQGLWVFIGRIYLMISTFILSVILTKILSVETYGEYKYLLSILAILSFFSLPEVSKIIGRYIPRGYLSIYNDLLVEKLKFSLLGSFSFILLYYYKDYNITFLYLAIIYPFLYSFEIFNSFLQAKLNFKLLNKMFIIRATILFLILICTGFYFNNSLSMVIGYTITLTICNLLFYLYTNKKYIDNSVKKTKKRIKNKIKKQTLILSLIGILPIISQHFDKILIAEFISYEKLAIFSIGILIGSTINGFFKPFIVTINAKLVHMNLRNRHYLILFTFGTFFGIILAITVPYLILKIYGVNYIESYTYAQIVVLSMGLYFLKTVYYNQHLYNKNKSLKKIYINNILTPIIVFIFMIIFITIPEEIDNKLYLMAFLYPLNLLINIIITYLLNLRKGLV